MSEAVAAAVQTWNIDAVHSDVGFVVRHMVVSKVRGSFQKFTGSVLAPAGSAIPASFEASIDTNSVSTRDEQRDGHLRSADFFDVATYPAMTFKSTNIQKKSDTAFTVTGDLTIRGVTKSVTFDAQGMLLGKDPFGYTRIGFSATLSIAREDFGLTWNAALEAGGVVVSNKVDIELDVQAVLAA